MVNRWSKYTCAPLGCEGSTTFGGCLGRAGYCSRDGSAYGASGSASWSRHGGSIGLERGGARTADGERERTARRALPRGLARDERHGQTVARSAGGARVGSTRECAAILANRAIAKTVGGGFRRHLGPDCRARRR